MTARIARGEARDLPGVSCPYSAITNTARRQGFQSLRAPFPGFRNLPTGFGRRRLVGLFHPTGTSRVSSSRLDHPPIGAGFPALAPSPLSVSQGFHPPPCGNPILPGPLALTRWDPLLGGSSSSACADRLPSQTWTDLGALLPTGGVPLPTTVSPAADETALLTFAPSGSSRSPPGPLARPTSVGFLPLRGSLAVALASPTWGAAPLGVLTFWCELPLQSPWSPRLLLPFGSDIPVTRYTEQPA